MTDIVSVSSPATANPLLLVLLATIVGLLAVATVSARLRRWRRRPAVAALASTGLIPLAVGALAGPEGLSLVDTGTATQLEPLFVIGCAWVALIVGLQARPVLLRRVPATLWHLVGVDLAVAALLAFLAITTLSRLDSTLDAGALLFGGTTVFVALSGWNPETRSLRVRFEVASGRLATIIQAGSGLAALLSLTLASVAASSQEPAGVARAMLAAAAIVGAGWVVMADRVPESALATRRMVVLVGMMAFAAGAAGIVGIGPMMLALLIGVAVANVRGPLLSIESVAQKLEPLAAWLVQLGAGLYGASTHSMWWLLLPISLAATRFVLKPALLRDALRREGSSVDLSSPLMQATARQAPLAVALALNFALFTPSTLARDILLAVALAAPIVAIMPIAIASVRRIARRGAHT